MSDISAQNSFKTSTTIRITIVHADPVHVDQETLSLPAHSSVRDALAASTLRAAHEHLTALKLANDKPDALNTAQPEREHIADSFVGIWGRRVLLDTLLTDGDRIELYRPVIADAKAARLNRASEQGYRWQGRTRRAASRT
jgi:uncharacterized protein